MIRYITIIIITQLISIGISKEITPILQCLAKEETSFHKGQVKGPLYKLNQGLISEFIIYHKVYLHKYHEGPICNPRKNSSPSIILLKKLLLHQDKIFYIPQVDSNQKKQMKFQIDNLVEKAPEFFLQWLSNLQAMLPTPDCLNKHITGLVKMKKRIRYLQNEPHQKNLIGTESEIKAIFKDLSNIKNIIRLCKKDKIKRSKKSSKKN